MGIPGARRRTSQGTRQPLYGAPDGARTRSRRPSREERWLGRAITLVAVAIALVSVALVAALALGMTSSRTQARAGTPTPKATATQTAGAAQAASATPVAAAPCHTGSTQTRMLSADELERAFHAGRRLAQNGRTTGCASAGLEIPAPSAGAPNKPGQVMLVSLSQQWLWAYQDGKLVFATPVTTGKDHLETPTGSFHVTEKVTETTFYSPWPEGSPDYYTPEHVNYALLFREGGYYVHDAPWRHAFGPGTNNPHTDPDGVSEDGSHGCVNVPTPAGAWLYTWASTGAAVDVVD